MKGNEGKTNKEGTILDVQAAADASVCYDTTNNYDRCTDHESYGGNAG